MTQRKSTKRALLMSALALLVCISMLIGSTFAWFTDEVTSAGNVIKSGTLDVDLVDADGNSMAGKMINFVTADGRAQDEILWEPGCTYEMEPVYVVNNGNLALKYQIFINGIEGDAKLLEAIDWTVTVDGTTTALDNLNDYLLPKEKTGALVLSGHMKEEAGNEYQGLTVEGISITVYATQYTHESDSFSNKYDVLADYSIFASQSKTLANGADSIEFVLSDKGTVIAKISVPASAIADTSKPVTATVDGIDPTLTITVGENTKAYAYDIDVTNLKENLSGDQLVTVTVSAPNALPSMNAYHNGVLIEDAVYDEVNGIITFKTASFSPYAFDYDVNTVSTWEDLRNAVKANNVEIQLAADLTVDLAANGSVRSEDHTFTSTTTDTVMYNGVNISGQNVAIDLNGHTITAKCGISDVNTTGALFFVEKDGSLNIIDRGNGGTIKMENCFYMVWAPFADPSYVDIYSGIFLADNYANDPMAPGKPAYSENDNRALVYAGSGGNMNIYGGYFLYENTPNDNTNRNNGAFNALDLTKKVCITIHPDAKLINAQYKQDPTYTTAGQQWGCYYDAYSIKLKNGCTMQQVEGSVTVGGTTYNTWYGPVQSGPEVWNVGFISVGQLDDLTSQDEIATYQYYARLNKDCDGKNGEKATDFVNADFISGTSLVYNYQLNNTDNGLGSLTVTGVTKDTPLGFTGGYISFKEYENIVVGYYVDEDLSTFVPCVTTDVSDILSGDGFGTNCHSYAAMVDVSGFANGSNHTITFAVQAVKMVNGQKVAYETVDLCQWNITMAN